MNFMKLYHLQLTTSHSSSRAGTRDPQRVTDDVDSESHHKGISIFIVASLLHHKSISNFILPAVVKI
jgi:hypothetical protein